jgi:hypothetical protein
MTKIDSLNNQIEAAQEKIRQGENRLRELMRQQKEEERKARTRRLCTRAGHIESRLPETIPLTDEQFFSFVETALFSPQARSILSGIIADGGGGATPTVSDTRALPAHAATQASAPAGAPPAPSAERQAR